MLSGWNIPFGWRICSQVRTNGPSVVIHTHPTKKRLFMSRGGTLSISTRHSVLVSSTTLGPAGEYVLGLGYILLGWGICS